MRREVRFMDKILMKIKGTNGQAIAYENHILLQRKGIKVMLTAGIVGDRVFYYKDISSIEFRKPGLINGHIKIIVGGIQDTNSHRQGIIGTKSSAMKDVNTLVLRAFRKKKAQKYEEFYFLLQKKIDEAKSSTTMMNSSSTADELKKYKELLDCGAITEEEYDKKKKQLLNV